MAADAAPDRVAVGSAADGMTLAQLLQASRRAAEWISDLPGGTVAYTGLNGAGFPIALFGASLAGRAFSPLNYRLPDADLRRLLARSAPAIGLCDGDMRDRLFGVDGVNLVPVADFLGKCLDVRADPVLGEPDNDIAVILFTSGTTSEPKAAILRHGNLADRKSTRLNSSH